ncbi:hypothetical protein [Aquimarina algiphila]|uniref:hypothetical protein n=1 Tax=Aquimarina algiphila TaxID=2047982 RepID=UPI00232B82B3|nr:hypothetical protein [Aquimarina algiphila]
MNLPSQSYPIIRSGTQGPKRRRYLTRNPEGTILASSFFCSPCKWGVGKFGSTLIGMGCAEAVGAFEVACNAAFDVESGGLAAIPCTAAGVALGVACKAGSGAITQGMIDSVAKKACSWAC